MNEKDSMKISVVIATYNYGHFIERAINSVIEQNDLDYELIIVDDGSSDNTNKIVEKYLHRSLPVQYFYQKNQGASVARNKGIDIATGNYILILDSDDKLLPGALKHFREQIKKHPDVDAVFAQSVSVDRKNNKKKQDPILLSENRLENFRQYSNRKISLNGGASLIRKNVFEKIQYLNHLKIAEDIPFFAHVLALFNCRTSPERVLEVYEHPHSMRNQIDKNIKLGLDIVDSVFTPRILPPEFMKYKAQYYSRRCLSLFRALYLAGRYQEAREFYIKGIQAYPPNIFLWAHLRKYLLSFTGFSYLKKEYL